MDWSSVWQFRAEAVIVVGFVFLLNPFIVGVLDIGDPDRYRYEASEVSFSENGSWTNSAPSVPLDSEVACFSPELTRSCVLEQAAYTNGGFVYDGVPGRFIEKDYRYVWIWNEGFFRPVGEALENGTVRYGLEPVPLADALDDIATPIDRTDYDVQSAIETGSYTTSDRLPGARELVQDGDTYQVVYPTSTYVDYGTARQPIVVFAQWVLGTAGALLILRGQRYRVER